MKHIKSLLYAACLAVATTLMCVVLADGIIGMESYNPNPTGKIVFWVSLVLLPVIAQRFVKWRFTLINLPLYFGLLCLLLSSHLAGDWLQSSGGWITFPDSILAAVSAVLLWAVQSVIYGVCNIVWFAIRKM